MMEDYDQLVDYSNDLLSKTNIFSSPKPKNFVSTLTPNGDPDVLGIKMKFPLLVLEMDNPLPSIHLISLGSIMLSIDLRNDFYESMDIVLGDKTYAHQLDYLH
jgi:hypothetical protein